jgi:hypothetical protein
MVMAGSSCTTVDVELNNSLCDLIPKVAGFGNRRFLVI